MTTEASIAHRPNSGTWQQKAAFDLPFDAPGSRANSIEAQAKKILFTQRHCGAELKRL
ncbi:MAG: hypothetical protein ACI83P_002282 [Janthinobacterium sp.]